MRQAANGNLSSGERRTTPSLSFDGFLIRRYLSRDCPESMTRLPVFSGKRLEEEGRERPFIECRNHNGARELSHPGCVGPQAPA
jgi:hypothetical protein